MMTEYIPFREFMMLLFRFFRYLLLISCIVAGSLVFAGEKIFSTAYKAEKENNNKYYQDATKDLYKKYNSAIQENPNLKQLSDACGGCDFFSARLDAIILQILPGIGNGFNIAQIVPAIHPKVGIVKTEDLGVLYDFMVPSLQSVKVQTDFQIKTQQDLDSPGRYMDADTKNSPFDLMDDLKKILALFMKNPLQYDGYTNTMKEDASGLITGRFETGSWAEGQRYEIDLASDIASALGEDTTGSSGGSGRSGDGSDCEDGFCITLDIITSDSYSTNSRGGGTTFVDANFEEIFSSANEWLIKKGDKRNLACKAPPPINHFQSNNDLNLFFKNIFRGLGIFVFKKTPPYAKSNTVPKTEKTAQQKEKDTDDTINTSLKNLYVDKENLMAGTVLQSVAGAAPAGATYLATAENQRKALRQYQDYQKAKQNGGSTERKAVGSKLNDTTIKNHFRTLKSQIDALVSAAKDATKSMKALKDKPPCQN